VAPRAAEVRAVRLDSLGLAFGPPGTPAAEQPELSLRARAVLALPFPGLEAHDLPFDVAALSLDLDLSSAAAPPAPPFAALRVAGARAALRAGADGALEAALAADSAPLAVRDAARFAALVRAAAGAGALAVRAAGTADVSLRFPFGTLALRGLPIDSTTSAPPPACSAPPRPAPPRPAPPRRARIQQRAPSRVLEGLGALAGAGALRLESLRVREGASATALPVALRLALANPSPLAVRATVSARPPPPPPPPLPPRPGLSARGAERRACWRSTWR
jgi:hypothetical protein